MTAIQFIDFINKLVLEKPDDQRFGQWAFNLLFQLRPDIANEIRGTDADPFYDNGKIQDFFVAF